MQFPRFAFPLFEGLIRVRSIDASAAQKGLWLAQKMSPGAPNHALFLWDVDGELDAATMGSAFRHVLNEAAVLRVTFAGDGADLRQAPRELGDWQPFQLDLRSEADPEQAARAALAELVAQPFDLERDLLIRMGLVTLPAARSLVVIAYHHLVSDGYGMGGLLSRRLAEVYTALVRGSQVPDLPDAWDVESFAAEEAAYRTSSRHAEDTEFWRGYLADAPPPAQVPRVALSPQRQQALSAPVSGEDRWAEVSAAIGMVSRTLTVPRAAADAWTEAAKSLGVWRASLLAAGMAVFLRHRCDRPEFLFSLAVGNRTGVASRTPGLAVNVVPVRARVPLGATFAEIAEAVTDETYEVLEHTFCHYSDIQRLSGAVLGDRGNFGAVLNVAEFAEQLSFAGSPARYVGLTTGTFDELSIGVYTDGSADSDLFVRLDAPASMYSRAELRLIGEELVAYLQAAPAAGSLPVGALDVLQGADREEVLGGPARAPEPMLALTVAELFARQVDRSPDAVALVSGDRAVTYRELDERSSRVAAAMRRRQVGPETVVAVTMRRSIDLAVALLGIVRAGGAPLPIGESSGWPAGAAPASFVLTDADGSGAPPAGPDLPTVRFGEDDADGQIPVRASHPDSLLTVLDDSGPVAVTHRNLQRFFGRAGAEPGTVLWHSSAGPVALAVQLWGPLTTGGRVLVAPAGVLDADTLSEARRAYEVSVVWLPVALFSAIAAQDPGILTGLREVWTDGDRVSPAVVRRVREACPGLTVVNSAGPAVTTVFAAGDEAGAPGAPLGADTCYVLGPGLAPVPAGVTGELYVAGPGVPRGCPGQPGPTAERFVPCPFGPPGGRMYRTGRRARWSADGRMEDMGPAGAPVDVNGARVEPAEIEDLLAEHPAVAQAVVTGRRDDAGQQRLVAHVVPVGELSAGELRRFAAQRLPEPSMPSAFMVLDRLPMTAGGRVDLAALPRPALEDRRQPPRNRTEEVLAEAFADVLGVERVGIDDDFFDLGGNSLRAIRVVGLIRAQLNVEVSIRTLFAARTIAGLSDRWRDIAPSSRPALRRRTRDGEVL